MYHAYSLPALESLSGFFGAWLVVELLPPIISHIKLDETDETCYRNFSRAVWRLVFYYGPPVAASAMHMLWSSRKKVDLIFTSTATILPLCPRRLLYILFMPFSILHYKMIFIARKDVNIPRTFQTLYRHLLQVFDRWEAAQMRKRRERERPFDSFTYRKLESPRYIRLLKLHRRRLFSDCTCDFLYVSLDKAPPFEAISYTWGDEQPSIPVTVSGRQILVTSAVDKLLSYRRSFWESKLIWIDAVCINQKDNSEKTEQLPLMTKIYQRASRVVVWLCPAEDASDASLARSYLIGVIPFVDILHKNSEDYSVRGMVNRMLYQETAAWIALGKLFKHSWFERMWVVQEIAVAKNVHVMYGDICVDWNRVESAAKAIASDSYVESKIVDLLSPERTRVSSISQNSPETRERGQLLIGNALAIGQVREAVQRGFPPSLLSIIPISSHFKSTDARDKVFAVLGIVSNSSDLPFLPNYDEPTGDIYIKTATFLLSSQDGLTILRSAGRGYEPIPESALYDALPSWVPDWSSSKLGSRFMSKERSTELYNARDKTAQVIFTSNLRVIQVQAVIFDRVQHSGRRFKPWRTNIMPNPDPHRTIEQETEWSGYNWYRDAQQLARTHSAAGKIGQELADGNLWEACIINGGISNTEETSLLSGSARKLCESFVLKVDAKGLEAYSEDNAKELETYSDDDISKLKEYDRRLWDEFHLCNLFVLSFSSATRHKLFCVTATGLMALVPPYSREGDLLCHVRGQVTPFVLRRKDDQTYELVGGCYVHGVEDIYTGSDWKDILLE